MITFKSLITGDFESEADREVAPFIMLLGFPVIGPAIIGYGLYKGAETLYYHNPIRTLCDRKRSIDMINKGENPFRVYNDNYIEEDDYLDELTFYEKDEILKESEEIVEKVIEYNPIFDDNYSSIKLNDSKNKIIKKNAYKTKKLVLKK